MPTKKRYKPIAFQGQELANLEFLKEHLIHPDISITQSSVITIKRSDARADEDSHQYIHLNSFWLPPNKVHCNPQLLLNRSNLITPLVFAMDKYLLHVGVTKSRNARLTNITTTLAKFFEYMWLCNKFELTSLTTDDFENLAKVLAEGGWHKALNIRSRLTDALEKGGPNLASSLLSLKKNRLKNIPRGVLGPAIGTNIASREGGSYLKPILEHSGLAFNNAANKAISKELITNGMQSSQLRQTLSVINLLFDLPMSCGLSFVPYPYPAALAKKLTEPAGTTKNLGAIEAGSIVAEAYKWLYKHSDNILGLIREMCEEVKAAHTVGRKTLGYLLQDTLKDSTYRLELEREINIKITGVDVGQRGSLSVRDLLMILMSACFVLIAAMNARRRDEINHRKYGLYIGFAAVVDEEMEIYTGNFYIEKTLKDYEKFYINKSTWKAALTLEAIQMEFDKVNVHLGRASFADMPERERSLFGYHRFSRFTGMNVTRNWYTFEAFRQGAARKFAEFALGEGQQLNIYPHMFRRMYALVFMYQHEIPSLQALSQQLAHDSLASTQIYVNDRISQNEAERIINKIDSNERDRSRRFARHLLEIQKEVDIVRDEKLIEIMLSILNGEPTSGGYPNFIKRFYRRIMSNVDFSQLTTLAKAEHLVKMVKQRGQFPAMYRHGICVVGTPTHATSAHCKDVNNAPAQENATPSTCNKCPFHYHNEAYLRNLETDLAEMSFKLGGESLMALERKQLQISIIDLKAVIADHKLRLKIGHS